MSSKSTIKVSVRNLVEFILMGGDLVFGFTGSSRNNEAIKAHQLVQKAGGDNYQKEVHVSYLAEEEDINLEVNGRIDGVIKEDNHYTIDEIKTTTKDLEYIQEDFNILHWAQAKCYGFIFCLQNNLETIDIQLTYYHLETRDIKRFVKPYSLEDLREFFYQLVKEYMEWARIIRDWSITRDISIQQLKFPFGSYRKGQRELAVAAYRTIKEGGKLFAQAPTGIGKTMATLFPTVKALGEGHISKIFYLTAKTITRTIAEDAVTRMYKEGLRFKTVTLTAKDKICFKPGSKCNPEDCEFAKGHYDRVKDALRDILDTDFFTREVIEQYANKHNVCPFEFSLDLSNWCDCIICDYNYAFDPRVYLKRFFMDGGGDYGFLIDEAHNLVDRAREMFSAELFKKPILTLKTATKDSVPELSKVLNKINSYMVKARKECEENNNHYLSQEQPKDIYPLLRKFTTIAENWLLSNPKSPLNEEILELYFEIMGFQRTAEYYDERYVTYFEKIGDDVKLKLFCLDPSHLMNEATKRGKSAIFFSATLSPIDYFIYNLGGDEKNYRLKLPSPFDKENLCVLVNDSISTKYRVRDLSYNNIAKSIYSLIISRKGNYLAFFPSYQYMKEIHQRFLDIDPNVGVIIQNPGMNETEREDYLKEFTDDRGGSLVGFAVMGGIFGEGIDLAGDRLSGAVVVGVGLPQICLERDIIKDYFQQLKGSGFEYSYIYPGINKVMQAVGRVIRTEEDRGVVLLIDERFSQYPYRTLLPNEWQPINRVRKSEDIEEITEKFWRG